MSEYTLSDAADLVGVTPATLRRWQRGGLIPQYDGDGWNRPAVAQARIVARLRSRGHTLKDIREASDRGRLAFGFVDDLLPEHHEGQLTLRQAARRTGLEPALIERIYTALGLGSLPDALISPADVELLQYAARVLDAGFPLVAFLQLARVYGQALAQIADAEVRLFHLYVHEPLMREGVPGIEIADQMSGLAETVLPLAMPIHERLHRRFLAHFVEQDVIGHMEIDTIGTDELDLGRLRVAIAFADLAGYTRLTEEQGDEQAVDLVEHFIEGVEDTLPEEARVVKMLGDEVMIVCADAEALAEWAVGFQTLWGDRRPQPRIGVHHGEMLYRDGDYYGREVNRASRVVARAGAGEVIVTRAVVDQAAGHLAFELIGEVKLKGFNEPTELFHARARGDE